MGDENGFHHVFGVVGVCCDHSWFMRFLNKKPFQMVTVQELLFLRIIC